MYNYYTDLKKKQKEEENKKKLDYNIKLSKIHKRNLEKFTKNYEERVKNFMYDMTSHPIYLQNSNTKISTNREDFLNEEKDKILSKSGFIHSIYRTDRENALEYDKKHKELMNYLEINNTKKNQNNLHYNKNYIFNEYENNSQKYKRIVRINQPSMRFKPRSDLERIYDTMVDYRISLGDKISRKALQNQLNKMGFKEEKFEYGFSPEDLMEIEPEENKNKKNKIDKDFIESNKNMNKFKKYKKNVIYNAFLEQKKNKLKTNEEEEEEQNQFRLNNSGGRILHNDLYNKTYFNALVNFSLFKNSCFLPEKFENKTIENNSKIKMKLIKKHKKNFNKKYILDYDNPLYKNNINSIEISSSNDLINMLNNENNFKNKEEKIINSLNNVDLMTKKLKEKTNKLTKKEKCNLNILHEMAFEGEKYPIIINNITNKIKEIKKNNNSNDSNEIFPSKPKNTIIIDKKVYNKNDFETLSKLVMEKCHYFTSKFKKHQL